MKPTSLNPDELAYPFLRVGNYRAQRPRTMGMTCVIDGMDSGFLSIAQVEALADFAAPYIDFVKLGWLIPRFTSRKTLLSKIEQYHKLGIRVFTGGGAMQAALIQGKAAEFIEASKRYGVDAMEVGTTIAHISPRAAVDALRRIKDAGLLAFLEIGRKGVAADPTVDDVRRHLDRLMSAGGDFLIVESERIDSMDRAGTVDAFLEGCAELGLERLIFELPYGLHLPALQPFATRLFASLGPDANVANVEFAHVMGIATIRTGTCFGDLFGRVSTDILPPSGK